MVEPVDPFGGRQFDFVGYPSGLARFDQLNRMRYIETIDAELRPWSARGAPLAR